MIIKDKKALLSDQVVGKLKRYIADHGLKTGDRLPTEDELARTFGVSRVSLRGATKPLRYLGLLNSAPRRGLTVGDMKLERLHECLDFHFMNTSYSREQLLHARMIIETGVLPHVIQAMARDPELYPRLYALTDVPRIVIDPDVYIEADIAFHTELVQASGVQPLIFFHQLLRSFFEQFRAEAQGSSPAARERGVHYHRRIIAALRDGQLMIALDLVRETFEAYNSARGEYAS